MIGGGSEENIQELIESVREGDRINIDALYEYKEVLEQ